MSVDKICTFNNDKFENTYNGKYLNRKKGTEKGKLELKKGNIKSLKRLIFEIFKRSLRYQIHN